MLMKLCSLFNRKIPTKNYSLTVRSLNDSTEEVLRWIYGIFRNPKSLKGVFGNIFVNAEILGGGPNAGFPPAASARKGPFHCLTKATSKRESPSCVTQLPAWCHIRHFSCYKIHLLISGNARDFLNLLIYSREKPPEWEEQALRSCNKTWKACLTALRRRHITVLLTGFRSYIEKRRPFPIHVFWIVDTRRGSCSSGYSSATKRP